MTKPTRTTTNNTLRVALPIAQSKDFEIIVEDTVTNFLPNGIDRMYGIRSRITGLVELRGTQLAASVMAMQNMQSIWDRVVTGELNGYMMTPAGKDDVL